MYNLSTWDFSEPCLVINNILCKPFFIFLVNIVCMKIFQ